MTEQPPHDQPAHRTPQHDETSRGGGYPPGQPVRATYPPAGPAGYPPAGPAGYPPSGPAYSGQTGYQSGPAYPGQPGYQPGSGPGWVPQQPAPGYGPVPYLPPPAPVSPAGQPLASFGDRFLAYLVDYAIMFGISMVLLIPAMIIFFATVQFPASRVNPDGTVTGPAPPTFGTFFGPILLMEAVLIVLMMAAAYVYFVELMFRSGQTVGKRVVGLRTVPLDPRETLTRGHAVRRWLVQSVAGGLVPFLSYLDGLWQLWDKPYQQCLHDKSARTVVVKLAKR